MLLPLIRQSDYLSDLQSWGLFVTSMRCLTWRVEGKKPFLCSHGIEYRKIDPQPSELVSGLLSACCFQISILFILNLKPLTHAVCDQWRKSHCNVTGVTCDEFQTVKTKLDNPQLRGWIGYSAYFCYKIQSCERIFSMFMKKVSTRQKVGLFFLNSLVVVREKELVRDKFVSAGILKASFLTFILYMLCAIFASIARVTTRRRLLPYPFIYEGNDCPQFQEKAPFLQVFSSLTAPRSNCLVNCKLVNI